MVTRIISGIILSIILAFSLFHSNESYYILIAIVMFGITEEITSITKKSYSLLINSLILVPVYILSLTHPSFFNIPFIRFIFILTPLAFMVFELSQKELIKSNIFTYLRPAIFLGPLLPYFLLLKSTEKSTEMLIFSIIVISCCDTFAYFIGKHFGKTPLSKLSPKKTIEGSLGGILVSLGAATGLSYYFHSNLAFYLGLATILSILSQCGDLHESLFKRTYQVKDSSNLIPGHGGMYDRTDSYIFTIPLIYVLIQYL